MLRFIALSCQRELPLSRPPRKSPETTKLIADVATHLQPLHGDNERLGVLLSLCIGRILLAAARRDEDWRSMMTTGQATHIRDWLQVAIINNADWLSKVDDLNRPKKLMKFGSLEAIVAEADKAMLKAVQSGRRVVLNDKDEEFHAELADGYYLVRLRTPEALDHESAEMRHCIGNGSYDADLANEKMLFLSMRAPNGKARATLEIEDGTVKQIQGKLE